MPPQISFPTLFNCCLESYRGAVTSGVAGLDEIEKKKQVRWEGMP
jgi:hypothetical protein